MVPLKAVRLVDEDARTDPEGYRGLGREMMGRVRKWIWVLCILLWTGTGGIDHSPRVVARPLTTSRYDQRRQTLFPACDPV